MVNKFRRFSAAALVLAMVFTVACDKKPDENNPDISSTTDVSTSYVEMEELNGEVAKYVDQLPDINVTKKLKWLAWFEIDETAPTGSLFKQKYGVPEPNKFTGDNADVKNGRVIEYWPVTYAARFEELGKRISTGDSPDIFQFDVTNYPYSIYVNLFQTIDGIIDLSAPEWDNTRDAIAKFNWGGKNYCPIAEIVPSYFLWYRKSVIEEAGLEDPYTLYKAGQWDWNKFLEICESFSDPDNDKYVISGWNPDNSFICTTGVGLITLDNGKLVNNMNDARIERVMELLSTLAKRDYRYPHHELNDWSLNYGTFRSGDTLFWDDGQWKYDEFWYKYRDADGWEDDELCLVPYPRDPNADKYYQQHKQDSYMLCAGSQNIEGYKAWIQCAVLTANDPQVKQIYRAKRTRDYGWTDAQLDVLEEALTLEGVFDFKNGIGEDVADTNAYESPVEMVTKYVYIRGESYTQTRAENEAVINARLAELNASTGS